ncbi:MAG: efflux RND transporter periplasmic adaptor subunit [Chitinophagaceae bacterium]|uniref:efflux RND transporter periplasmic adaptor subunit n=1 Tax=unclassified Paraflavitalea TaxID=2798305 RepID=UPI003D3542FF|nr:efflux RND transporter periplasmic adaptor subunit [Chitinophagaceae bacterium]
MTKNFDRAIKAGLLGLVLAFGACKSDKKDATAQGGNKPSGPLPVEGYVVNGKSLASMIEVPGSLMPFEETEIRSEISGRIITLNISEGNFVRKGAVLVKLFDGDLQAQLKKLEVQLQISEKTAERQRELLKIGGISQQEYDLSELAVNNLKADIEIVKVNISKTEIRAPFDGRLGLKNISLGAYISPSNLLTTISQVSQLKLQFTVPEKYGSLVQNGQSVQFQLDGTTANFQATVMATETAIEETTRSLAVRARVIANNRFLVPGAFAKVHMILGRQSDAIMIPSESVIPQGRKKQAIVYRDGKASFVDITTGVRDSVNVQVLEGLKLGDTVITTGLLFVRPGADLKLTKVN